MPEAVLRKPAPLTVEELNLVRTHPQLGYELTQELPYLAGAAELIWASCERLDGLGYPRGLRAGAIPLGSRIIAVADAYDTMTRPRVFRDAISSHEAFLELVPLRRLAIRLARGRGLPAASSACTEPPAPAAAGRGSPAALYTAPRP